MSRILDFGPSVRLAISDNSANFLLRRVSLHWWGGQPRVPQALTAVLGGVVNRVYHKPTMGRAGWGGQPRVPQARWQQAPSNFYVACCANFLYNSFWVGSLVGFATGHRSELFF